VLIHPPVILAPFENKVYVLPRDTAITGYALRNFINGALEGRIPSIRKVSSCRFYFPSRDLPSTSSSSSPPPPQSQKEPPKEIEASKYVKAVVGTSFDQLVIDNNDDVLVEFYSPGS
jgi:hypothetical protein